MPNQRFTDLMELFFLKNISEKELFELDQLLKKDKGSREAFVSYAKIHRQLHKMAHIPKGDSERDEIFRSIMDRAGFGEQEEEVLVLDHFGDTARRIKGSGRRLRRIVYGLAASFLVLLGTSLFLNRDRQGPSIEKYSKLNLETPSNDGEVRLIVQGREIEIEQDNPSITYSGSGEKIKINKKRTVIQDEANTEHLNTLVVPYGKRSFLTLADGTKVWLNSGSSLTYPSRFQDDNREVYLNGQAIFEVAHLDEKPFYVLSSDQMVKVLGTVFDVRSYANEKFSQTVLKSGSVEIDYPGASEKIQISPNTLSTIDKTTKNISRMEVDPENYMAWKEGVFVFNNENLESIVKTISRYYGTKVELDGEYRNINSYSGRLDMKTSIDEILNSLKGPLYFDYHWESDKIIITN